MAGLKSGEFLVMYRPAKEASESSADLADHLYLKLGLRNRVISPVSGVRSGTGFACSQYRLPGAAEHRPGLV
jgi:hypothetical protein